MFSIPDLRGIPMSRLEFQSRSPRHNVQPVPQHGPAHHIQRSVLPCHSPQTPASSTTWPDTCREEAPLSSPKHSPGQNQQRTSTETGQSGQGEACAFTLPRIMNGAWETSGLLHGLSRPSVSGETFPVDELNAQSGNGCQLGRGAVGRAFSWL